jgi:hypothetical protein
MCSLLFLWIGALIRLFRSQGNLVLENLVLRQQLAVLKRRHPRPSLGLFDKVFWLIARRVWSVWKESLLIVTPETVVRWLSFAKTPHQAILIRVTCYTTSLYVIDFTCALNFGDAQAESSLTENVRSPFQAEPAQKEERTIARNGKLALKSLNGQRG